MAEALAIVGSAAAILQLTDYSKRFLKFLKEYQAKTTNLPLSFQLILSQQHLLVRSLEVLEARAQQNAIDDDMIPHFQSLSDACHREMDKMDSVLNKFAIFSTTSRAKKAIKALRYEKEIRESAATLKDCINTLFMVYQINSVPFHQAHSAVVNADDNDVESLVTRDTPTQLTQEIQTVFVSTTWKEQHMQQQTMLVVDQCNFADAMAKMNQISLRLRQMFDEGIASPLDLDRHGNSLIRKRISLLKLLGNLGVPFCGVSGTFFLEYVPNIYVMLFQLIRLSLLMMRYVQGLENEFNPELLAFMMDQSDVILLKDSSQARKLVKHPYRSRYVEALLYEKMFPDYAECKILRVFTRKSFNIIFTVLDCNTLQLAILQRNVPKVEKIISLNPSSVHFQNALGQSPLHVASDWPWATVLLLMNGADPYLADSHQITAIDYACEQKNHDVVRILLDAGSPLPVHGLLKDIIECDPDYYDEPVFKLIISHLATRRRELLQIARSLLPEATLSGIVPPNEAVPDSSAYQLITAVCAAGHATMPDYWYYSRSGLYQSHHMFPAAADILYEEGFRYLEGRNSRGETLLSCGPRSAMVVWLYRKGVSFTEWTSSELRQCSTLLMPSRYPAIKRLAESMYQNKYADLPAFEFETIFLRQLNEDDFGALNIILQDDFSDCRDLCQCPCSSGGCSPEVIFLKGISLRLDWGNRRLSSMHSTLKFIELLDETVARLRGELAPSIFDRMSQAAIRMVLFSDLGMRHLCCKFYPFGNWVYLMCQEEADEIREEDRSLTERFEDLLPKAQSAWEISSKRLTKFWREFHMEHICRRRNGPMDKTALENLRELGVTVHERSDEEMYCDSLYDDEEGYCESLSDDGEGEGHCGSLGSDGERCCERSSPNENQLHEYSYSDEDEAEEDSE
ncbi:MAG: hypothetical protein Q9195_008045 [Heterodermia aff. obscurata]